MENYFLTIDDSSEERALFKYIKDNIFPGIREIRSNEFQEGRLFLLSQVFADIKGETHRLNTGIRLGSILKPQRAVIFYKHIKPTIEKSFLVNLDDRENLIENIKMAYESSATLSWSEIEAAFEETYQLLPHDDIGLKQLWNRQKDLEKEPKEIAAVKDDEEKEILVMDDEYGYFQKEMETAVKRRYPKWRILWAKDEKEADEIISKNFHLDMAILDLEFRGGDIEGKELLHKLLKGKETDFFFPIIVFSRCRDVDIIEEVIKPQGLGADDYISKFDILKKSNFNLLVSLMSMHMNQYDQVHDMQEILAPDLNFQTERYQVCGKSKPFVEVGGDVIDFVQSHGALTVYLADAVNHGFDAGLLSGMFKASIKTKLLDGVSLSQSVTCVDRVLCRIKDKTPRRLGFILTVVLLRFTETNSVEIANAGHLPILHYVKKQDRVNVRSLKQRDRALGMREHGRQRQTMSVPFGEGDIFVLFSDGISETKGRNEQDFDIAGICDIVEKHHDEPLTEICNRTFEAARKHGRQTDDRTLLLVKIKSGV